MLPRELLTHHILPCLDTLEILAFSQTCKEYVDMFNDEIVWINKGGKDSYLGYEVPVYRNGDIVGKVRFNGESVFPPMDRQGLFVSYQCVMYASSPGCDKVRKLYKNVKIVEKIVLLNEHLEIREKNTPMDLEYYSIRVRTELLNRNSKFPVYACTRINAFGRPVYILDLTDGGLVNKHSGKYTPEEVERLVKKAGLIVEEGKDPRDILAEYLKNIGHVY